MNQNPHIIGLTGSFGSGCSTIALDVLVPKGYCLTSLTESLKSKCREEIRDREPLRSDYQNYGDRMRQKHGDDYFAQIVGGQIKAQPKQKWVVDSIRNPAEIRYFRNLSRNFFLFGIYADKETRWARVKSLYHDRHDQFEEDDKRDSGAESSPHGQRVQDCFSEADVVITNDVHYEVKGNEQFKALAGKVESYLDLVSKPLANRQPRQIETLMASAYAVAQNSSCLKRKVGAIIVDSHGCVISSGYNEVPAEEQPCSKKWTECYRDHSRKKFVNDLTGKYPALTGQAQELEKLFKENFRILDLCRALHAEENAILNLTRNGRAISLSECSLYTTTYPCRLCANKITTVQLGKVVYVEPYPDEEAKAILKAVQTEFFEGVTYRAYFRIYGDEK